MGTRSTTKFYQKWEYNGKVKKDLIASIYTQYDGYPDGVGTELATYLSSITIVNGYQRNMTIYKYANGAGGLAAQYIAKIKTEIGNVYMTSAKDKQEYNYEVLVDQSPDLPVVSIRLNPSDAKGSPELKILTRFQTPQEFLANVKTYLKAVGQ